MYRFSAVLSKIPMIVFTEIGKYLQLHIEAQTTKASMNEQNNAGGIVIPDCKLHHRSMVTKNSV